MMDRIKLNPVLRGRCPICHFEEFHLVSCQLGQSEAENARLQEQAKEADEVIRLAVVALKEGIREVALLKRERDDYKALAERLEEKENKRHEEE